MNIIIPVFGFGKSGGYRVLSKLADQLIESGFQVSFISSVMSPSPNFPTKAKIIWIDNKGRVHNKSLEKPGSFLDHVIALIKAFQYIKKSRYDLIFLNYSLTAVFLPKSLIQKSFYYVQAYEPDYFYRLGGIKNYILGKLSEWSYARNIFTIVNSEIFKDFKKLKSSRVLHPGLDFKLFYPKNQSAKKDRIILGTIGRTEPYKGSKYIYEAFKLLRKSHPKLELHIAYGSEDISENIPGAICISPANDIELAEYYRSLDFYICALNMHLGAFHYPVAEAMACGVPVISTPFYLVSEDNSFVVEKNNARDIADKILIALENEDLVNTKIKNALSDVASLTWDNAGSELVKYIEEKTEKI